MQSFLASDALSLLRTETSGICKQVQSVRRPRSGFAVLVLLGASTLRAAEPAAAWVDRVVATHYAFAIADGMGAPIEKWTPKEIVARHGDGGFPRFLPSTDPKDPPGTGKGDGRITDDVLGVEALMRAYRARRGHLDAYDYAGLYLPEIARRKVWVPERQDERPALERPLPQPERYAHHRNAVGMVEPRQAGVGNWLNEGFNSIVWPIGAVNAGDPARAYAETVAFGSAHTESYGLEAAAVTAACFAEALGPSPTVEAVLAVATGLAKDGTRLALEAVLATVNPADPPAVFADKARRAWLPYSGLPPARLAAAEPDTLDRTGTNAGRPSRVQSIENLPAALAAFKWSRGDYRRALTAGLIYGRDAESIAAAASGLVAAMKGRGDLSAELCAASEAANRRDFVADAREFAAVASRILEDDLSSAARRRSAVLGRP